MRSSVILIILLIIPASGYSQDVFGRGKPDTREYIALIAQDSTDDPREVVVYKNTTGFTWVWERGGMGHFRIWCVSNPNLGLDVLGRVSLEFTKLLTDSTGILGTVSCDQHAGFPGYGNATYEFSQRTYGGDFPTDGLIGKGRHMFVRIRFYD